MKSVIDIEIRNFNIKKPTNIYYLNCYLDILKFKGLELPEEEIDITTDKLKEMIADLLNSNNKVMDLTEIYDLINNDQSATTKETSTKKPIFSIKELQRQHLERKGK